MFNKGVLVAVMIEMALTINACDNNPSGFDYIDLSKNQV
jgi:hypothetical protein